MKTASFHAHWLAGLAWVLSGCGGGVKAPVPAASSSVTLIASGDTRGWLVPCGCTSNQSGGLLRRATYVDRVREQCFVLLVDAGGAPGGAAPYDVLRFEAILRGEAEMGIAAHNIGAAEAALGEKTLRELQKQTGVPFVSANVVDSNGELVFPAVRQATSGGLKIGVIGVTATTSAGPGFKVIDPKQAVLKTLRGLSPRPDRVVVLAYLPERELQELAEQLPEVTAVIGGPTGQAIQPRRVGATTFAAATNKGKFLVELSLSSHDVTGQVVELGPSFADHERQTANLKRYLQNLADRDVTAAETRYGPPRSLSGEQEAIAGSQSCKECHPQTHALWEKSSHASAWQTLIDKEFQVDPYCQQCHTTGYGRPGGFLSAKRSEVLGGVGCESCHGPSQKHAADSSVRTPWNAADRCVDCHDHENSPQFAWESYWPQIVHGSEPK